MTQDEIIEMWNSVIKYAPSEVRIAEFAKLVAAKEREACAKLCDIEAKNPSDLWEEEGCWIHAAENCAGSIRARGQA